MNIVEDNLVNKPRFNGNESDSNGKWMLDIVRIDPSELSGDYANELLKLTIEYITKACRKR